MELFLLLVTAATVLAVEHRATVNLTDPQGKSNVVGNLTFVQIDDGDLTVTGIVTGLLPGLHGFHVHEKSDINTTCDGAGAHFNPFNKTHGGPKDAIRHVGDFGNIEANQTGVAVVNYVDGLAKLDGVHSILNRAIVVHSDKDDLGLGGFSDSKLTGHAGSRLACGVIVGAENGHGGSHISTTETTRNNESSTLPSGSAAAPLYFSWTLVALLSASSWMC